MSQKYNFTLLLLTLLIISIQFFDVQSQTIQCDTEADDYVDYKNFPNYVENTEFDGESTKCSYAGYNSINENKFFYWYFPSQSKLSISQIPTVLFINGPLGQTVLYPLFTEFGDFSIQQNEAGENFFTERLNSWTRFMSVVYIELYPAAGLNPQYQNMSFDDLTETLSQIIKYYKDKFPKQQVSLYTRDFGAKLALKQNSTLNNIILDHPLISVQTSLQNMLYGSVGMGSLSLQNIDIYNTLVKRCQQEIQNKSQQQYEECFETFEKLIINDSQLNPQDSRFDLYNSISNRIPIVESYMNDHLDDIASVLNLEDFTNQSFLVEDGETINSYGNYYGADNSSDLKTKSKSANLQMFYGQFNLMNGPQSGFQLISDIFGYNATNFPTRKLYSTGIMVSGGIESGEKMGYYYQIPQYNLNLNLFSIKQGYTQNTWLEQASELVYNMATIQTNYCYTYNQRTCNMTQSREQFFNQCSQNGSWNSTQHVCQCKSGFTGSDCSQQINSINIEDVQKITLMPREWYYIQLNTDSAQVMFQIKDEIKKIQQKEYIETELGGLQIFISEQGIVDDIWNSISGYEQSVSDGFQTYSINKFVGEKSLILKNPSYPYIAIGNSDYHYAYTLDLQQLTIQPVKDFWDSSALEVINIVMFIFAILLLVIGGYFLKQNSDLKKQGKQDEEEEESISGKEDNRA
ncbi:hypothetical protein PPERSA_06851 [Pseudocohnilembus persalinus]|uniref:EGF-like domain-containing protein n=1 Tax=Pseudocohnilembus persalinus TaxID=266149 RepID=A0A0V0QSQ1_PSEPJ|nr:hypothetical protein PPERSA_06851 [Pseudocohnilembus persalinus]|eukprot:KRX05217.1 hypothetical protein PPERSA_06851 [Pseudocohnilembus persalinus]